MGVCGKDSIPLVSRVTQTRLTMFLYLCLVILKLCVNFPKTYLFFKKEIKSAEKKHLFLLTPKKTKRFILRIDFSLISCIYCTRVYI